VTQDRDASRQLAIATACQVMLALGALSAFPGRADPVDEPAVIINPSAANLRELERVISEALHGVAVTLAHDALTTSNMISLEHPNPRDQAGRPFDGRELARPETFALFKRESRCVLVQTKTGRAWTLHHVRCASSNSGSPLLEK
jgi:hypothetical protein